MADKIEPALSPEEWKERGDPVVDGYLNFAGGVIDVRSGGWYGGKSQEHRFIPALIALANAALPDSDRRKLTREMVANIRECAQALDSEHAWPNAGSSYKSLWKYADALESYLPPE